MGKNEIISADSLRLLSSQVQQQKMEIHNLRRRMATYLNELDDVSTLIGCCLAESHPGRGVVFTVYLGTWNSTDTKWVYDTTETHKAIDWRYGVPYPTSGATGLFEKRDSRTYGIIYETVALDCDSPGACGS